MFSRSVMSNYLRPHGLQHTRLPCPSLSPEVCSNLCPLHRWCHPTISSSSSSYSFSPQSFPPSESFPMSHFFTSGGQSIGALASVLPMNIQDWFPLGLTGLISLLSKGTSTVFSSTTIWMHRFFGYQPSLWYSSHHLTILTFVRKVMSLLFNTLSRFIWEFDHKKKKNKKQNKKKLNAEELMLLNCGVGEDAWEYVGLQGDPTSPS